MTSGNTFRHRDALTIVAKYPAPGHVKTRLGATIGFEQSAHLYRAFLHDLSVRFTQAALADGYDLIWACVEDAATMAPILGADAQVIVQRGSDFAERLYHICCDIAELGYVRTIILSSDSPQAPSETIAEAFGALESADVVLGPADDGGYYLVGLWNQPTPPDLFTGITMSTPQVFVQTLARACSLGLSVRQVGATFDVDTETDLPCLAHALEVSPALAPRTRMLLEALLTQVESAEGAANGAR
jgi:hypothetical protein